MQEGRSRRRQALPSLEEIVHSPREYLVILEDRVRRSLSDPDTRKGTFVSLAAAGGVLFVFLSLVVLLLNVPNAGHLSESTVPEATIAYTADGLELTRYHFENRTWIPLDNIAPPVIQALLATEDHRFYHHSGVDLFRVIGAVLGTASGETQGGSTLTMQLARNVFPDIRDDWMYLRKVKEWLIAMRIEDRFSKKEILEMYLNMVPFMYDAVGIEAAARTYFEKPANELDVLESATLIGMLKGTVYYNPVRHPERAKIRRDLVLQRMLKHGYLDQQQFKELASQPVNLKFRRLTRHENRAPYFAEYVRQWLDQWAEEKGINLYTEGLRVYTTLDAGMQQAAEMAVNKVLEDLQTVVDVEWSSPAPYTSTETAAYRNVHNKVRPFAHFWESNPHVLDELLRISPAYQRLLDEGVRADSAFIRLRNDETFVDSLKAAKQRLEAGFVAIDPVSGHVKVWVGGRSFKDNEFDHVAIARRQPGSTFKPFVYAAALENGYAPYSLILDSVREYYDAHTGQRWAPRNFGGTTGRLMSLSQGLAHSKNTITAKLITSVGPSKVAELAHNMGIHSELREVPSLGLGTSEVSLLEIASAYTAFANLGIHREPVIIERIEDRDGNVIARFKPRPNQALPPYTAHAVLDMMRGVINYGTGVRFRSLFGAKGDFAGKTGTTQNAADGWFMLMHPNLVVGSWVGFSSPHLTFRSRYWGQGAHNALHVTGEFYRLTAESYPEVFDKSATFRNGPKHIWRSTRYVETDALNRNERNRNRLDKIIARIRAQKEVSQ